MSALPEVSASDWDLWQSLRSMSQQLSRVLDQRLQAEAGISQADYGILLALFEAPGGRRRPGELAEQIAWEKSRVSHQVARMEARGLVERIECDSDARGTWVTLRADGERALRDATEKYSEAIHELFVAELRSVERKALRTAARRVLGKLDASADQTNPPRSGAE